MCISTEEAGKISGREREGWVKVEEGEDKGKGYEGGKEGGNRQAKGGGDGRAIGALFFA